MGYPWTKTDQTRRRIEARKRIVARLDGLASEYVRKRAMKVDGGCQCCARMTIPNVTSMVRIRRWKDLEWAHLKSKGKHSTRWDENNAAGLCWMCHGYLDRHPVEKERFFSILLGREEFDRVVLRAGMAMLSAETDYKLIEIYLKELIRRLEYEGP